MNHRLLNLEKAAAYIKKDYIYTGLMIGFIILAAIISSSFSRDSVAYNSMFAMYGSSGWSAFATEMLQREVFIIAASKILFSLGLGVVFLFLIYAALSLAVKFHLIYHYSKDKLLSLAFFSSYFFILLDSTQIRFGMAVAFVYLGIKYLSENRKLWFALIVIFSSIMFHVAGFVFIIMLFFTTKKSMYWLLGMLVVAIILYPVNLNPVVAGLVENVLNYFELHGTFLNKVYRYLLRPSSDVFLGIFRPMPLLVYFCAIVIYQYRDKFNAYEMLCYNALLLSIIFYILLKDVVDLQVRFSDLFGFSLVFLVPYVHRGLSEYMSKKYAYIILYSFFAIHLVKYALYDKMLVF